MVSAGRAVLGGDSCEIADVLGQKHGAVCQCSGKDLAVRSTGELLFGDGRCFDSGCAKRFGKRAGVHLVEEKPHRASAAAVSLW